MISHYLISTIILNVTCLDLTYSAFERASKLILTNPLLWKFLLLKTALPSLTHKYNNNTETYLSCLGRQHSQAKKIRFFSSLEIGNLCICLFITKLLLIIWGEPHRSSKHWEEEHLHCQEWPRRRGILRRRKHQDSEKRDVIGGGTCEYYRRTHHHSMTQAKGKMVGQEATTFWSLLFSLYFSASLHNLGVPLLAGGNRKPIISEKYGTFHELASRPCIVAMLIPVSLETGHL